MADEESGNGGKERAGMADEESGNGGKERARMTNGRRLTIPRFVHRIRTKSPFERML